MPLPASPGARPGRAPPRLRSRTVAGHPERRRTGCPLDGDGRHDQRPLRGQRARRLSVHFTTDVLDQVFAQLLTEQADFADHPPTFAPELATSYEWSADRRILTFHLRSDATWSDGAPITADDVRFTWEAQTSPEVAWSYAHLRVSQHRRRRGRRSAHRALPLRRAVHLRPGRRQRGGISSTRSIRVGHGRRWQSSARFAAGAICGRPVLAEWKTGEHIVLARNERYFVLRSPASSEVNFRIVPDAAAMPTCSPPVPSTSPAG
ncbi:MAG: ABC transporter substrate-binding protein [Thermoanaerobaculia bacterium]